MACTMASWKLMITGGCLPQNLIISLYYIPCPLPELLPPSTRFIGVTPTRVKSGCRCQCRITWCACSVRANQSGVDLNCSFEWRIQHVKCDATKHKQALVTSKPIHLIMYKDQQRRDGAKDDSPFPAWIILTTKSVPVWFINRQKSIAIQLPKAMMFRRRTSTIKTANCREISHSTCNGVLRGNISW